MSFLRFTFGVEFEFSIATLAEDVEDPFLADNRQVRGLRPPYEKWDIIRARDYEDWDKKIKIAIAQKLRDVGLPALTALDLADQDIDPSYPWSHGHWVVTTDSTIEPPEIEDAHDWWGVEVNSPPYIFCKETNVNESCGLHVHVGNGNDNFDFDNLRNLMAFLWCFEPVIDKLHPGFRFNGMWCRSMRASSRASRRVRRLKATNVDILKRIFEETSVDELFNLMGEGEGIAKEAYYTGNLRTESYSDLPKSKVTLEFRQHEGTLDGPRTVAWVQTVVGLFDFAADCDRFWMAAFLMEHAELEDGGGRVYEIVDLLTDIGLEDPAKFYANRPHLS